MYIYGWEGIQNGESIKVEVEIVTPVRAVSSQPHCLIHFSLFKFLTSTTVELYNWAPLGRTFCPLKQGAPNSGASGIFLVGKVLRKQAIELHFQSFLWLYAGREG